VVWQFWGRAAEALRIVSEALFTCPQMACQSCDFGWEMASNILVLR
jgi:hypothetical protein